MKTDIFTRTKFGEKKNRQFAENIDYAYCPLVRFLEEEENI